MSFAMHNPKLPRINKPSLAVSDNLSPTQQHTMQDVSHNMENLTIEKQDVVKWERGPPGPRGKPGLPGERGPPGEKVNLLCVIDSILEDKSNQVMTVPYLVNKHALDSIDFVFEGSGPVTIILKNLINDEVVMNLNKNFEEIFNVYTYTDFVNLPTENTSLALYVYTEEDYTSEISLLSAVFNM